MISWSDNSEITNIRRVMGTNQQTSILTPNFLMTCYFYRQSVRRQGVNTEYRISSNEYSYT